MTKKLMRRQGFRYIIISFFILVLILSFISFDVNTIRDFFYNVVGELDTNRFFNLAVIFSSFIHLRSSKSLLACLSII